MFETIRSLLASQLDIDEEIITRDTDIIEDLGADSLDLAELMSMLEDEYGFVVDDEDVHDIHTVEDVERYVADHVDN